MRRLILLRHAKTESTVPSGGDFERALTERGLRDAALIARALAKAGLSPNRVLISDARRARQTWGAMAAEFPNASADYEPKLYLASQERIAQFVEVAAADLAAGTLMVVGHNPGLHEYAAMLLDEADRSEAALELHESFPTACAAVFTLEAGGAAKLERRLIPRDVGGGPL
jgi:phosphohistidine phosphatase